MMEMAIIMSGLLAHTFNILWLQLFKVPFYSLKWQGCWDCLSKFFAILERSGRSWLTSMTSRSSIRIYNKRRVFLKKKTGRILVQQHLDESLYAVENCSRAAQRQNCGCHNFPSWRFFSCNESSIFLYVQKIYAKLRPILDKFSQDPHTKKEYRTSICYFQTEKTAAAE